MLNNPYRFKQPWASRLKAPATLWLGLLIITGLPESVLAQNTGSPKDTASSFRDRVTDKVTLKSGEQIWGFATSKKPARLVVRTAWLEKNFPDLHQAEVLPALKKAVPKELPLARVLDEEIQRLEATSPDEQQRIGLLKEIHRRLIPDFGRTPDFVVLEFPKSRLRSTDFQPDARRELCRTAIMAGLIDYEESHWKSVTEELRKLPSNGPAELAAPNQSDPQMELQKVLAAVDVRLNSAARLIRQGDQIIDESSKPDLATLMSMMLGGNLQNILNELLNEGAAAPGPASTSATLSPTAIRIAESNQQSSIVLSEFQFNLDGGSAGVARRLFRKMPDGQWKILASATGESSLADLKPGQSDAISNDPQLKEISAIASSLGLGDNQLDRAIQMGAVVQNALRNAERLFEQEIQDIIAAKTFRQSQEPVTITLTE